MKKSHTRDWRAPREHRAVLCVPPFVEAPRTALENKLALEASSFQLWGRSLAEFRAWTRQTLFPLAQRFTQELLSSTTHPNAEIPSATAGPWIVTGHQPALFHPGVWIKNLATAKLAKQTGGIGLNLIVDHDISQPLTLRVPLPPAETPTIGQIPFDELAPAQPWEELSVSNLELFRSFPQRVRAALAGWLNLSSHWAERPPLLETGWPAAVKHAQRTGRLAESLCAARVQQEATWQAGNLELPMSQLAETEPFRAFALHLFLAAEPFRDCHNRALADYRKLNKIRSQTHPVPELERCDDWVEVPFWIWKQGETCRSRLFVRTDFTNLENPSLALGRGAARQIKLMMSFPLNDSPETRRGLAPVRSMSQSSETLLPLLAGLEELSQQGWRLRPRALATTLFARLCLADLFIHGIGGAKYDEMTDRLFAEFFQISPPKFLTMTATLHLPFGVQTVAPEARIELHTRLRDLKYHPEKFLADNPTTLSLHQEKQALIEKVRLTAELSPLVRRPLRPESRKRREALRELDRQLANELIDETTQTKAAFVALERDLNAQGVLQAREYAWLLHSAQVMEQLIAGLTFLPK